MARVLLLLFTVLCSVLFAETAVDIQRKKAMIHSLGQCKGQESLPMVWYDFKSTRDENTGVTVASLKVRVKAEISKDLGIMFNFWKCDASGNPDSCEQFLKDYFVTDICTYMVAKDEMWTPFMDAFTTPIVCPIKPGIYELKSMPISPSFLKYLPVNDATWKVQLEGYDKGKKNTCVALVLQIISLYVKRS